MGYDMEMDDFHDEKEFEEKELERLKKEILEEAKKVVEDYVDNPSDISGSVVNIHQNSPYLEADENEQHPLFEHSLMESFSSELNEWLPEIPESPFFQISSFLMPDKHDGPALKSPNTTYDCRIVGEKPIPVKFGEIFSY